MNLVLGITGWRRYAAILALDAIVVSLGFYLGYFLRFEGRIPPDRQAEYPRYLLLLLGIRMPLHLLMGIHRWSFRMSGFHEAVRLVFTTLAGTLSFAAVFFFMQRAHEDVTVGPPRSVIVLEFFLTLSLLGALRFSPRLAHTWFLDTVRFRAGGRTPTIIVGAGSAGDLLLRDLRRSDEHSYDVVGFVDDNPAKWGTWLGGRPVLGPLSNLPELARRRSVSQLLFAIPRLPAARLREILTQCTGLKLQYRILPVSYTYLKERRGGALLQDLAPEDLLSRDQVRFDEREMRALIEGRRILVTGAGGSIGSEICRQVASYGPSSLTLLDMNENELYLLFRELQERHPAVRVGAEVADIRDPRRLQQLGRDCVPQDILHAAAHKHVPLMEDAPEESVKNNVVGCLNVARMADEIGAERFVLISTDKAVNPSSVMGATKKIAELIVSYYARRSRTAFTAVRFGNVLGSAGSVVPLFKAQIARGGPVTVTDPGCRRYLMTIREAVGLVLLAGLGRHGELCILEMGEPIRILDLARMMIALAGLVPDEDIAVVFTGLRPGEKLEERLTTDEEERSSRAPRQMIRVIETPPAPSNLIESIGHLEVLAQQGDREGIITSLGVLVPGFEPAAPSASPPPALAAEGRIPAS